MGRQEAGVRQWQWEEGGASPCVMLSPGSMGHSMCSVHWGMCVAGGGTLTGVLDCSVNFCSHIFSRRSRSLSSCSLQLRSRSSFFSLSRVASISHLCEDNQIKSPFGLEDSEHGLWACLSGADHCASLSLAFTGQALHFQRRKPSKLSNSTDC